MKNRKQFLQSAEDDKHEDVQGEEIEENCSSNFSSDEDERCPICLNCLAKQEVCLLENCNHIFCMNCILKWAETRASCPVDRKHFKAVYRLNTLGGFVKVQIKQQINKEDDLLSYSEDPEAMKNCTRKQKNAGIQSLPVISNSWNQQLYLSNKEEVTNLMKKNKPRRQTCLNRIFRSNWCDRFSSNGSFSEELPNHQNESIEISKIDTVITDKRRELELSCSVLARVARIPYICCEAEISACLVMENVFSISTSPSENFGSSKSEHIVTCVHGGEEKKKNCGTAGTRGTRRKVSDTPPPRRSVRNVKTETSCQSQNSPKSSNSGYEAGGDGSSFVNVSFVESEKLPPKQKVRRGVKRQETLIKKKLRSSGRNGQTSSDLDVGEQDKADVTLLDKGSLVDSENNTSDLSHKNYVETESAQSLENLKHYVECKTELKICPNEGQNTLDILETDSCVQTSSPTIEKSGGSCVQNLPLLIVKEDTKKYEEKYDIETNVKTCTNAVEQENQHFNVSGRELCEDTVTFIQPLGLGSPTNEVSMKLEPVSMTHQILESSANEFLKKSECALITDDTVTVSRCELLMEAEFVAVADKMSDSGNEFQDKLQSDAIAEKLVSGHANESLNVPETLPIDGMLKRSTNELSEGVAKELLDNIPSKLNKLPLEMEDVKTEEKEPNESVNNENLKDSVLIHVLSEDKDYLHFEKVEEKSKINTTLMIHTHFNKDDNEVGAMECDSFNNDQNESQVDQLLENDSVVQEANSLINDSKDSILFSDSDKQQAKECFTDKKTRIRRSRFHSPSTTWSPSKRGRKRSQSPSPKRDIISERGMSRSSKMGTSKEYQRSLSKSPKRDSVRTISISSKVDPLKEDRQSLASSPKSDHMREGRNSPSSCPKRDSIKEGKITSRTRARESSLRHKCRSQSKDRESDLDEFKRDHEKERSRSRWSQPRSRSRSRSRSRPRSKGSSFPRNERDSYSPPRWKERWANDSWRSPMGTDRYKRNEQDKQTDCVKRGSANKDANVQCSSEQYRKDYPDWVMERINSVPETRNNERGKFKNQQWEENKHNNSATMWNRNDGSGWNSYRNRGSRGRGICSRSGFMYKGDQVENRWQNRKPHLGSGNSSGSESSRFQEHQPYKCKAEQDFTFDTPADRSGWTSASSWAVRKTLPADVQNYYSRRGRNSSSPQPVWTKEEVAPEQDSNFKDQASQQGDASQLPINVLQPQMNVMTPVNAQHQPMSIFPYTMGVPTPVMNIQHNPFNLPPPVPMHLHSGLPLIQVAASSSMSQGPPPPPPPPPPSQQINYIASQLDGKQLQAVPTTSHVVNNMNTTHFPAPTAALGTAESLQGPSSDNATASNNVKTSNAAVKLAERKVSVIVEASADSSKKDQKLLIQEKAAQEVKLAIKPFYQNKDISKEEYKEIVRKAVDKVCHSKSGEVNSVKVANLVKAYVDKYKHSRKKNPDEVISVERK